MPNLAESLGKAILAQGDDLPPTVKLFLMVGTYMQERYHGRMYAKAQNLRPRLRAGYDKAFEQFDLLVMPTVPAKAYRNDPNIDVLGIVAHSLDMNGNTAPFNLTGHPAYYRPLRQVQRPSHRSNVGRPPFRRRYRHACGACVRATRRLGNPLTVVRVPETPLSGKTQYRKGPAPDQVRRTGPFLDDLPGPPKQQVQIGSARPVSLRSFRRLSMSGSTSETNFQNLAE